MSFSDADEFATAISDAFCTTVPLVSGSFAAAITQVQVGDFTLQRASVSAHINHGLMHPDRYGVVLPTGDLTGATVNGYSFAPSNLLILAGGADLEAVCKRTQAWSSIACGAAEFEQLMEFAGMECPSAGSGSILVAPPSGATTLVRGIGALAELAETMPSVLRTAGLEQSVTESLREMLTQTLVDADRHPEPSLTARDLLHVVNNADGYLREHITRPIYTEELCTALGVSPRKLHNAFASMYGISPHAYLKRRRLMLAHQALRTNALSPHLVKSVALAHGFWHLGNFAHDYRALFGNMPSNTRPGALCGGDLPGREGDL